MCELCLASISRHHSIQYEELWTLTLTTTEYWQNKPQENTYYIYHNNYVIHTKKSRDFFLHGKCCMHHKNKENFWLLLHFISIGRIVSETMGRRDVSCMRLTWGVMVNTCCCLRSGSCRRDEGPGTRISSISQFVVSLVLAPYTCCQDRDRGNSKNVFNRSTASCVQPAG